MVVLGVWLIFGPLALMPLFFLPFTGPPEIIMAAALFPISFILIWKTTRRYLERSKREPEVALY
jgi:hypothetical protein